MNKTTKIILETLIALSFGLTNVYAQGPATGEFGARVGASLRDRLIESKAMQAVYAINDHLTLVAGEGALPEGSGEGFTVLNKFSDETDTHMAYLIKYDNAQPFGYKNPSIPSYEDLTMPANGEINLGALHESGVDLYQHMTALCRKFNGEATFVIPKRHGKFKRLTSVDAAEAFNYILFSGDKDNAWLMACEGTKRFVVEKNFQSVTKGEDTADFYSSRGLEGVNYVKNSPAEETAEVARVEATPAELSRVREQMAWEISSVKMDFVKPHGEFKYTGTFNGYYNNGSCGHVTIKEARTESTEASVEKLYDYKVCNNSVVALGEKEIKKPGSTKKMYAGILPRP